LPSFHRTNSASNLAQRANQNRRSFDFGSFNTDDGWSTEEEEDDESLARRLQEEEFSSFNHRRSDAVSIYLIALCTFVSSTDLFLCTVSI